MNKTFKVIGKISMMLVCGYIIGACTANPDSSGLEYMPDMYRSPAIEPYVDYAEVRGRVNEGQSQMQSALVPPSNTIPYFGTNKEEVMLMLPYHRKPGKAFEASHGLFGWEFSSSSEADYEYNLAAADVNPYKLTPENQDKIFEQGKNIFMATCAHCHGEKGDGKGPMVVSGAYSGVPNYADKKALSDGQMFYSIYYGKGAMGGHASIVNKKEIWTLVHYIRKLQDSKYGAGTPVAVAAAADSVATNVAKPQ